MDRAQPIFLAKEAAGSRWLNCDRSGHSGNAPKQLVCATMWLRASMAIITHKAARSRLRYFAPKELNEMIGRVAARSVMEYCGQFTTFIALSLLQLVRR